MRPRTKKAVLPAPESALPHATLSRDGSAPEAVRLRLLGGFGVSVGSRTVGEEVWRRKKKAAALLKLLALAPGHRMHREQAMELLWPHLGGKAAANNLHRTLYAARRTLEADPPATSRYLSLSWERLALCPEGELWVDAEAFEQAAAAASRSQDPEAHRAAIDLYAGELLPEDRYEGWAEQPRRRLQETHLWLLLGLARLREERGDHEGAAEALGEVLAEDPLREEAHVGLMRLHALCGRQGEALRQYERLEEVLSRELGAKPGAESRALRDEVAAGRFPPLKKGRPPVGAAGPASSTEGQRGDSGSAPKHNLPAQRTGFVGREREMLEVKRQLAMTRLLTLTGAGGSGKTRLALEEAGGLVGTYPDGVWLAELAPLSEGALVPQAVAKAVGVAEQPGRSCAEVLVDALRQKGLLLVLDNCEHLIEATAQLADALLSSCPLLRVLATGREALGLKGELVWRVDPLSFPDAHRDGNRGAHRAPAVGELARYDAVRLFLERARRTSPRFELTAENAGAVARICRGLEGMPLAIELAAARMDVLEAGQIAERLDRALGLLTSGSRAADPRHRTLRAALTWSYELLNEPEQRLFSRLSVFAGGFSLEAAEAVGAGEGIDEEDVLEPLLVLVDKSLVVAGPTGDGAARYRLLEPVRQYARERLEASGEADAFRRRHAEFFLALAEEAEPQLRGSEQAAWFERLDAENDNLRAALSWLLQRGEGELALRLGGALGDFWHVRGHLEEGRRWLEAALAKGDDGPATIKALLHAGWIAWEQLDYERSEALGEEALARARDQGDRAATASALYILGAPTLYRLDLDRATGLFEEAARLQRSAGDVAGLARTIQALGLTELARQDFELAVKLYEESLAIAREAGDQLGIVVALGMGAFAFLGKGDHRRARDLLREGLELSLSLGARHAIVFHLHAAAALESTQGQPVRSARLWGAGEALMDEIGTALAPVERYHYGPYIDAARALLDEEAWEAAFEEGRAMSAEGAAKYALSEDVSPSPESSSAGGRTDYPLTRRELEVVALVGRGLTNRQIAQELNLSERTIGNHVSKILRKLHLASRTQVATWATGQGLVVKPTSD